MQLTAEEVREVVLAIDAYRQALERCHGRHTVADSIRALNTARGKVLAGPETGVPRARKMPRC